MTKHIFTFILDYMGGTYIAQETARTLPEAIASWITNLSEPELKRWKLTKADLEDTLKDCTPVAINDAVNVWCFSGTTRGGLLLVNVIATSPIAIS